jgi:serine/threonine protein kinase/Tol biopolymer transport system component
MPVAVGTLLGRYEIRSKLGEGGMGEVYIAWDSQLERNVALKVLPSGFASDTQRMNRFVQEAKAASALNHPNILTVYDVGTAAGGPFVVSELLDGHTLREHMGDTALSQRKAVDFALQIAHGLAAAHDRGIVHRDIKPENLFVTRDDRVKILDFGIAKLVQHEANAEPLTDMPTRKMNTEPGVIIGTTGYMSPEQVRGERLDHRSDIFSFGAVFYELVSGERAFKGQSTVETLNAILHEDPPELTATGGTISPAVDRVIRRCLEKNREHRFRSAHDLAFALEAVFASGTPGDVSLRAASLAPGRISLRERLLWVTVGLAVLTSLAFGILYFRRIPPKPDAIRFAVSLPENVAFTWDVEQHNLSLSPDGRSLAFIATHEGQSRVWLQSFDSLSPQPLAGTEGAYSPFWSPDSRFIAFFAEGKLKKIDASGSAVQTICELSQRDNIGTWGRDGTILFSGEEYFQQVHRVSAAGGQPSLLLKTQQRVAYWFHFLPDGRHFVFFQGTPGSESTGVYVGSLDSTEARLLIPLPPTRVEYAPPGYLIYVREGTLLAQPFDATSLRIAGEPFVVVDRLPYFGTGWAEFSVSETGVLAYMTDLGLRRLAWMDREGRQVAEVGQPGQIHGVRLSPDGQKVALTIDEPRNLKGDLWIHDFARGTRSRFTFGPGNEEQFVWSPDGRRAAFFSDRPGSLSKSTLRIKDLEDPGEGESPLEAGFHMPNDWSMDGRFIIYMQNPPTTNFDLWVLPLFGDRKPFVFLQTPFTEGGARFSPDGRWVAFMSNESGQYEVYVARFDNPREKWRMSSEGGNSPRWRRDGKELFYVAADNRLMSVSVRPGKTFEADNPTALFKLSDSRSGYDVTADGKRFLFSSPVTQSQSSPFAVVANWTALSKR